MWENNISPCFESNALFNQKKSSIVIHTINRAISSLKGKDVEEAARVRKDDEVDDLCNQVIRELFSNMIENPRTITRCIYLIWISINLERIADRITNICERTIFMMTSEMIEDFS